MYQEVVPILLCTITFRSPPQRSLSDLAFAKAGAGISSVYIQLSYSHTTQKRLSSADGTNYRGPEIGRGPGVRLYYICFLFLGSVITCSV